MSPFRTARTTTADRRGRRASPVLDVLRRASRSGRGRVGLILVGCVVLTAAIGPAFAPHSPTVFIGLPFESPSPNALLGTDVLGRDVLSRVLHGGWVLLLMSLAATVFGVAIGTVAGISAAYFRGSTDNIIMRAVDILLAFPQIVFALLFVTIVGPKLPLIVIVVGLTHAPGVARVLRAAALDVSERDYVKSIELMGIKPWRIGRDEILPNLVAPLMVETGLRLTYSIITIAGLAFLGFGQPPPAPNWGIMIGENRVGLQVNPWGIVVPAVIIALLTVGTNLFTDAVTRAAARIDPEAEALVGPAQVRDGLG